MDALNIFGMIGLICVAVLAFFPALVAIGYVLFLILGVLVIGIYSMSAATYRFMSRTAHRLFPSLMKRLEKTYMTEEYKPGAYARLAPCRRPLKPVKSVVETQEKKQEDETNA